MVGSMLWASKPGARRLSVGVLPLELAYWVGFALQAGPMMADNVKNGASSPADFDHWLQFS